MRTLIENADNKLTSQDTNTDYYADIMTSPELQTVEVHIAQPLVDRNKDFLDEAAIHRIDWCTGTVMH